MNHRNLMRCTLSFAAAVAVLACIPVAAYAQFTNPNDKNLNAYFTLRLERNSAANPGLPARWATFNGPIELQIPEIDLCIDGLGSGDCNAATNNQSIRIPDALLADAARESAHTWNQQIRDPAVLGADFFVGCDAADCDDLPTYTPLVPTAALIMANGDNAGNATADNSTTQAASMDPEDFNPGNRTCVFPAWSVNSDGSFDSFIRITSIEPQGEPDAGFANAIDVGSAADATMLCTHSIPHTELDLVGGDGIPDTFRLERDAFGRIRVAGGELEINGSKRFATGGGDDRNRLHYEQADFFTAAGGGDVDPDGTLAVTITRGLRRTGVDVALITEADILFNADLLLDDGNESGYVHWTTNGATASSNCRVGQEAINPEEATGDVMDSPDEDGGGTQLCYRGTDLEYNPGGNVTGIFDVANVMTHEMGHFVGLDHPCREFEFDSPDDEQDCRSASDPTQGTTPTDQTRYSVTTMFWSAHVGQTSARTVEQPDVDGLEELFAIDVSPFFVSTSSSGFCTISPRSHGWGPATWALLLLPALLLIRRRRAPARIRHRRRGPGNLMAALLAVAIAASAGAAHATMVVTRSTAEMAAKSEHVAHVQVTDVQIVRRPDGWISTVYTLSPVDSIKGDGSFEISVPGGQLGSEIIHVAGAPSLQVGREYIVFAERAKNGRNIVLGLYQGVKAIARDAETGITWVRTGAGVAGTVKSADQHGVSTKDAAIGAQELPQLMQLGDYKDYLRGLMDD